MKGIKNRVRKFLYCDLNMADSINRNMFYAALAGGLIAIFIIIFAKWLSS